MDSRPDSDLPPIYSDDHSKLLQPMVDPGERLDMGGVLIPDQLLSQANATECMVYVRLVVLARSSRASTATLPPIREFAKSIGIGELRVRRSLDRLHEIGWITIANLKGPRDRFRIVVKKKVLGMLTESEEMIEREVRKRIAAIGRVADSTLHNIYYLVFECMQEAPVWGSFVFRPTPGWISDQLSCEAR